MISNVQKYLIIGLNDHLDAFFDKAQEKGFMEFISVLGKKSLSTTDQIQDLHQALKILRKLPVKEPINGDFEKEEMLDVARQIITLKGQKEKLLEEERVTEAEISLVHPLGEFSLEDIKYIEKVAKKCVQFFCMSASKELPEEIQDKLIYINSEYDLNYFISIEESLFTHPDIIEVKLEKSLGQLKNHLAFIKENIRLIEAELKGFAAYTTHIYDALLSYLDEHSLSAAKKEISYPLTSTFFAVEAWVPESKVSVLQGMIGSLSVYIEQIAIEKDEKVPTYIENKGMSKIGEDLVKIYDIPSASDKDPSPWVLWTFALFFAMIVADGGYGLIYLATALYFRNKMQSLKPSARRMVKLVKILGISCIIWGVLTTSFFGISIKVDNPLMKFSVLNYLVEKKAEYHVKIQDCGLGELKTKYCGGTEEVNSKEALLMLGATDEGQPVYEQFNRNILLEFSIFIGLIHICSSLLRYCLRNYANIGWVLFAIGGYLYFPSILNAASLVQVLGILDAPTAYAIGYQLILVGIGSAMGFALIQNKLKGFGEIANLVQIFADILSYLRLYALALASSIMAATFNKLGTSLGLVFGALIILSGHAINFILGTMGGVIHGLRLNFIEWYHYSFEGGGRLLNPLKRFKTKR